MVPRPLEGVKIIEMAGKGAAPYAGVLLAEYGADVVRVVRRGAGAVDASRKKFATLERSRHSIEIDLKDPRDRDTFTALIASADALFEGFRPGVMERLGFGPIDCQRINSRLVFGRITGWGQDGPLAQTAGHDLNFLAVSGALAAIGSKEGGPVMPLNLLADFAGGSLFLVIGILLALRVSEMTGCGQVVDASMLDGVLSLTTALAGIRARGDWVDRRSSNFLDGGAPFYRTYRCADGRYVALGAVEPKFWRVFIEKLDIKELQLVKQHDRETWDAGGRILERVFLTKDRDEWIETFEGIDCCISPVLELAEVTNAPHMVERRSFVTSNDVVQPRSAPRLSQTPIRSPVNLAEACSAANVLSRWRVSSV
jgi:alpha-methylacyl-CoA racemase